jgi:signal transduction histidine kinase
MDFKYSPGFEAERLPDQIEITLFRIAQEAITNIFRHSLARHASIILTKQNQCITLLIEDDGQGFDPFQPRPEGRYPLGIIGMQERTNLIGGEFALESNPGKGTVVRIRIPLPKEEPCLPG